MLGSTVLYSSGDDGVAGNGGECLGTNGTYGSFLISSGDENDPNFAA